MLSKVIITLLAVIWPWMVQAQVTRIKRNHKFQRPFMGRKLRMAPPQQAATARPRSLARLSKRRQQRRHPFRTQLRTKRQTTKCCQGTVSIYPPYPETWVQRWQDGTGVIYEATAGTDGYVYQSADSYAWGMASSRCWVSCQYIPPRSGYYRVTLWAYAQGALVVNTAQSMDEVYAYRSLGLFLNGGDGTYRRLAELHYNSPVGQQSVRFDNWDSISKEFWLEAGRTYWFMGYAELGGWSYGSVDAWQQSQATTLLAPFVISFSR